MAHGTITHTTSVALQSSSLTPPGRLALQAAWDKGRGTYEGGVFCMWNADSSTFFFLELPAATHKGNYKITMENPHVFYR